MGSGWGHGQRWWCPTRLAEGGWGGRSRSAPSFLAQPKVNECCWLMSPVKTNSNKEVHFGGAKSTMHGMYSRCIACATIENSNKTMHW
jgi:hypothetical protein